MTNRKIQILSMMLMLLATATACSDDLTTDEEIKCSTVPISFSCEETEEATRGSQITTTAGMQKFVVHARYYRTGSTAGRDFFDGQVVDYQSSGTWTYSPIKYWPEEGEIDFYAYAPRDINGTLESLTMNHIEYPAWLMHYCVPTPQITSIHELDGTIITAAVFARANDAERQQDLLIANTPAVNCANQSTSSRVAFTFRHVLAALQLQFANDYDFPANTKYVILAIAPMCCGGTLAFDTKTPTVWTLDESEATFYQGYELSGSQIINANKLFFLPPQTLKNFTITARFYDASYTLLDTRVSARNSLTLERGKTTKIKLNKSN